MPQSITVTLVVIGLILYLAFVVVIGGVFNLWIQSLLSGARIGLFELIGMRFRKVDPRIIVLSRIRAVRAGLDITTAQLEAQHLAGGRVANCITVMIAAAQAGRAVPWDEVAQADLAGIDILSLTREALDPAPAPAGRRPSEQRFVQAVQAAPPATQPATPVFR